ncbi:hypothetical protein [Paenibacillus chitinolyticus]|uniref:hypothetical protein n=1 Tax=Paenibacillus chitinolyticus TaxID=79263 RepID=UPI003CFDEDEE
MSVNELGLTFDETALYNDLIAELSHAVYSASVDVQLYMKTMASEVLSDESAWFVHNAEQVQQTVFTNGMDSVVFYVGAQHWYAFLDNYGTGSLMDRKNPFLNSYIQSGFFNKDRLGAGMAVLGRAEGAYRVPDFKSGHGQIERESSGSLEGKNLEKLINPRTKKPYYIPEAPKHWLETSMKLAEPILQTHIERVFDNFNFSNPKYLKGGVR